MGNEKKMYTLIMIIATIAGDASAMTTVSVDFTSASRCDVARMNIEARLKDASVISTGCFEK